MAKRRARRKREPVSAVEYADDEGNVLRLRETLSAATIRKINAGPSNAAASSDDAWRRRTEMLFERLVVSWDIAGLPLTDQAMLLGRYRMADATTQQWVRSTLAMHVRSHIPDLEQG